MGSKKINRNLGKKKGQLLILSRAGLNGWSAHKLRCLLQAKYFENLRRHGFFCGLVVASGQNELSPVKPHARNCDHRALEALPELSHEWRSVRIAPRYTRIHNDNGDVGVCGKLFLGFLNGGSENQHHLIIELTTPSVILALPVLHNEHYFLVHLLSSV